MDWKISPSKRIKGEISVPADKSISHRAIMFGAISGGDLKIRNFLPAEDCMRTLEAFRSLGVEIKQEEGAVTVHGKGLKGLRASAEPVYLGNSGTSMRIMSGILAGQDFTTVLTGDESLSKRPMRRIIDPLTLMGAAVKPMEGGDHAPLMIQGREGPLSPVDYVTPVASAQVKSCVLAAGLYADGTTIVTEPFQSRDHTERMLEYFSADIRRKGLRTEITGLKELASKDVTVPGDLSSAAFFIVAALLVKDSSIILRGVGLNHTRKGILDVLKRMGGDIEVLVVSDSFEPKGDLEVRSSKLRGTVVKAGEIPLLIDEIPVLMVAAAMAEGETIINGVGELKVKETDRVKSMTQNLSNMGVHITESKDSLVIPGGAKKLEPAHLESFGDHRTAMSMAVASLLSGGECVVKNTGCADTSYPGFLEDLQKLTFG